MSLKNYFSELIEKVESSNEITNAGKDRNGFYKPQRTIIIRHLSLLRDLYDKPRAKPMVINAWKEVVDQIPFEWLALNEPEKSELQKILN
jgi:hypothetical protein